MLRPARGVAGVPAPRRGRAAPFALLAGLALFLGATGYLVASSLVRPTVPTFEPTPARSVGPSVRAAGAAVETVTVDARDPHAWRFFELSAGGVVAPPDTSGWDLAFRRHHVMAGDAAADVGRSAFDSVTRAPERGYLPNAVGSDTVNPAMRRWYHYGLLTHLLTPKGHVYVVRTREGTFAKVEVLSYYCTGLAAGCVTFRYTYPLPPARR